jgi:hypothetical protein
MSNIVKRNSPKLQPMTTRIPIGFVASIHTPKAVKIYWKHLKEVFEAIWFLFLCGIGFGLPLILAIVLIVKSHFGAFPPEKGLAHGGWYWLGLLVFSIFWYTAVWAYMNERQNKPRYR